MNIIDDSFGDLLEVKSDIPIEIETPTYYVECPICKNSNVVNSEKIKIKQNEQYVINVICEGYNNIYIKWNIL